MKRLGWDFPYTFLAVAGVILISAIALWLGFRTFTASFDDAQQAYATRKTLFTTKNLLLDQETGVRGFTSTRQQIFLQPYLESRVRLPQELRSLGSHVKERADLSLSGPYHDLSDKYATWSSDVVNPLVSSPSRKDATQLQRRGKSLMDDMRRDLDAMLSVVDAETSNAAHKLQSTVFWSVIAASAVAGVLLILSFLLESRRRRAESDGRRFFETTSDMLCVATFDGRFLRVSPSWHDVLGYSDEELTGRPFLELIHPMDLGKTVDAMSKLTQNLPVTGFQNRYRAKDGTYRSLVWNATPDIGQQIIYASARDETDRVRLEIELAQYAITDVLTGLPNRRWFLQQLEEAVAVAKRYRFHCSLLFIDLDGFKAVNDTLGHPAGDAALREIASVIRIALRESDLMARLGGDEFAVLLPPISAPHRTEAVAAKVVQCVFDHVSTTELVGAISVSIGIAEFPRDSDDGNELIAHADAAMYAAKQQGGAKYVRFHVD